MVEGGWEFYAGRQFRVGMSHTGSLAREDIFKISALCGGGYVVGHQNHVTKSVFLPAQEEHRIVMWSAKSGPSNIRPSEEESQRIYETPTVTDAADVFV